MLIADNGIIMRVRATEISKISRDTKGVRIMTLKNEGKVVCAAVTEHEELEENAENVEGVETSENAVETPVENNDVPASKNTEE
jgi:DNA gyrase subunit A